jgi:FKBP-type peptidyl-prolyl cis-trans isomerase
MLLLLGFQSHTILSQVIGCWDKGFATMRVGEKAVLTCDADEAYGERGSGAKIPGGATLRFDVELLSFSSANAEL